MKEKSPIYGFGFIPIEGLHHFLVEIPKSNKEKIIIYERFQWDNEKEQLLLSKNSIPKVALSKHKWDLIKNPVQIEFNKRLKEFNKKSGKWKIGQVPLEKLFGKELVVLAWAIEDCDPNLILNAIKNWNGLRPEEKWWLYTKTNASTGNLTEKIGWRKALRYALTENPIKEKSINTILIEKTIKTKTKKMSSKTSRLKQNLFNLDE